MLPCGPVAARAASGGDARLDASGGARNFRPPSCVRSSSPYPPERTAVPFMRLRLLTVAICLIALLAVPAAAGAAATVGLAHNRPQMFTDPLFANLGARQSRSFGSWNV